jgi:hypothetical protein
VHLDGHDARIHDLRDVAELLRQTAEEWLLGPVGAASNRTDGADAERDEADYRDCRAMVSFG